MKVMLLEEHENIIKSILKSENKYEYIICKNTRDLINRYKEGLINNILYDVIFIGLKGSYGNGIKILKKIRFCEKHFNSEEIFVFVISVGEIEILDKFSRCSEKFLDVSLYKEKELLKILENYKNIKNKK